MEYNRKEFMKLAGINNRQMLNHLMKGYRYKGKRYPPVLVENVDYKKAELVFFPSAVEKVKKGGTK